MVQQIIESSKQSWASAKRNLAARLLERSEEVMKTLFLDGDLTDYLCLLSRLPNYYFRNLLLIYDQYPEASCLAGFSAWQKLLERRSPGQMVLKAENIKKNDIKVIAPFTNVIEPGKSELVWFSLSLYDVKQTNIANVKLYNSAYTQDSSHFNYLLASLREVLGTDYRRSVVFISDDETFNLSGLEGYVTEHTVQVHKGLSDDKLFHWLLEVICNLAVEDIAFPAPVQSLLTESICFCLLNIWGLPYVGLLSGNHSLVPAAAQEAFLDALQRIVFDLSQRIEAIYLSLKEEELYLSGDFDKLLIDDPEALF